VLRAEAIGLPVVTLPTWYDVDDAASLARLADDFLEPLSARDRLSPYAAPATRACLAGFGGLDIAARRLSA
jgi:hypothetical protein